MNLESLSPDVQAAVERLRRVDAGESRIAVYNGESRMSEESQHYMDAFKVARAFLALVTGDAEAWRPIESAPNIGFEKHVLIFIPDVGVLMAWQSKSRWYISQSGGPVGHRSPTHWMPLPDPPAPLKE